MKDPFAFIGEQSIVSDSQLQLLNRSRFFLEDLSLQSNSSDSSDYTPPDMSGIVICSPPNEQDESSPPQAGEEECFQTPEKQLINSSSDEHKDPAGGDSSVAVDLDRDTDLVFSDPNNSTEVLVSPTVNKPNLMDTAVTDILEVNDFNAMISSEESQGSERLQDENVDGSEGNDRGENPLPEDGFVILAAAGVSNGENLVQTSFVTLDDLSSVDENDLLVVAIRAGWKFPRPRHWGPQGSRTR